MLSKLPYLSLKQFSDTGPWRPVEGRFTLFAEDQKLVRSQVLEASNELGLVFFFLLKEGFSCSVGLFD